MIETKVPKDVRSYKTKVIGPFTMRQLVCGVAAVIIDIIIFSILSGSGNGFSADALIYILIFVDVPIFAFTMEVQGLPLEKYIQYVLLGSFLRPNKRKAGNLLYEKQKKKPLTSKEKKEREKAIASIGRKNPELKAFR